MCRVALGGRHVGGMEEVGHACQVTFKGFACIAFVKVTPTDVGQKAYLVVGKLLVDVNQEVEIGRRVLVVLCHPVTCGLREKSVGRCVELAFKVGISVIHARPTQYVEPRGDVPTRREAGDETLAIGFKLVTVNNPEGVLHAQTQVSIGPVLRFKVAHGIVHFVYGIAIDVVAGREKVGRHQGVVVHTLTNAVAGVLLYVKQAEIQFQHIFNNVPRVAESKVVAVVSVVGNDAARINCTHRNMGLAGFATRRQGHRVGNIETRIKEIERIIARRAFHFLAPAGKFAVFSAVGVLELRRNEGSGEGGAVGERHLGTSHRALLRGDKDNAIGAAIAIKGGSRRTRQHRHAFDVVGVDVRNAVTVGHFHRLVEVVALLGAKSLHGDAVENIKRVVLSEQRFGSTHHHARRASHARRTLINGNAGYLSGQGVHKVSVSNARNFAPFQVLHVVGKCLCFALYAQCSHHHFVQ